MHWIWRFLLIAVISFFTAEISAGNTNYIYDEFGRIKEIQYTEKQQHYRYDDVGNRLENIISSIDLNDPTDTDGDGLPNAWESLYGLNPLFADDAFQDIDADGLTNLQEYQANTDPTNPDTDGDGIIDSQDPDPILNAAWLIPIINLLLY